MTTTMTSVDAFMAETLADMRRRLALLDDDGDKRALEDGIALLTDYRLDGMDTAMFERLLATLRAGRSPVGMAVLKPETIGAELARRWEMYVQGGVAAAR